MSRRKREFFDALERIENDDDEFMAGAEEGYMVYYDTTPPLVTLSCTGLLAMIAELEGKSAKYNAGYLVGFSVALGENDKRNQWASVPPPDHALTH